MNPMRVLIDLTALLPDHSGVDQFLRRLVLALGRVDKQNRYGICLNYEDRKLFDGQLPDNFSVRILSCRPRTVRLLFQQGLLPVLTMAEQADVVHSPSFIMPYMKAGARHVVMMHDMTSFSHPHCHIPLRRSLPYRWMVLASLRRADVVTVPSLATRHAILDLLPSLEPNRIRVTVPGIGEEFQPYPASQVQPVIKRLGIPHAYILYVGTIEPRKNLPALLKSYRRLLEAGTIKEHLVLAGKWGWDYEPVLRDIQSPALRAHVHVTGYVDQRDLPFLYAGARLFVFPSLFEGFGFPPLEAMACGVPTISTRSSSLLENLEGAAELVDPDDTEQLTDAMQRLLHNEQLRAEYSTKGQARARQYQWEQTARETMACYRTALSRDTGGFT